jgi:uncharacterized membrane protein
MNTSGKVSTTVLKAIALALAVAAIVLSILGTASVETMIVLLSIGLLALVLATFR